MQVDPSMELLSTVAHQSGNLPAFFDTVFTFLRTRTDFFHIMTHTHTASGFPPGKAKELLLHAFDKHQSLAVQPQTSAQSNQAESATEKIKKQTTGQTVKQPKKINLDDFNGAKTQKYTWEQTLQDLTLQVPVPHETAKVDIICDITRSKLRLKLRNQPDPLIDGKFPCDDRNGKQVWEQVRADECTWSLAHADDIAVISIYLEKARESWWKSVLEGDEQIDTTKVDSTRSMYDYDDETQGAIRKIVFDEHQKRKGQPTSDELQTEETLRKAWDAEGSPFQGTPFDASKLRLS